VQATSTLTTPESDFAVQLVDPATGMLRSGVEVRIVNLIPSSIAMPNKVCSMFLVTLEVTLDGAPVPVSTPLMLSIRAMERCPGAGVGSGETIIQLHDIQPEASVVATGSPGAFSITIWVIIDFCLLVSEETILKVEV
jgi:hypothetical protein